MLHKSLNNNVMVDVLSKSSISVDPGFMLVEALVKGQVVFSFSHFVLGQFGFL